MLIEEVRRTLLRTRNIVVLILLAIAPVVLGVLVKTVSGGDSRGGGPPFFNQVSQNPVFLSVVGLSTLEPFLLPLAVALVAGDSIAGEAMQGSLRTLLLAPSGRLRVVGTKLASTLLYALVCSIVIATSGFLAGLILFPSGSIVTLSGTTVSNLRGLVLVLEVSLIIASSMFSVCGVGVLISTLTDSAVVASGATVAVVILSEILASIPQVAQVQPLLLSNYWDSYVGVFRSPQALAPVFKNLLEQTSWLALTSFSAVAYFAKKDILS